MADGRSGARDYGAPFACAPGMRIEAQERLSALQFAQLAQQIGRIEAGLERLEKRLWIAVYGAGAVMLAQAAQSVLHIAP